MNVDFFLSLQLSEPVCSRGGEGFLISLGPPHLCWNVFQLKDPESEACSSGGICLHRRHLEKDEL